MQCSVRSLFAVVSRFLTQFSDFRIPQTHFVVRVTQFFWSFWAQYSIFTCSYSSPTDCCTTDTKNWRMALISVTTYHWPLKDVLAEALDFQKFFWYLIFKSITISLLKLNYGYFFDAQLVASGLPYFQAW